MLSTKKQIKVSVPSVGKEELDALQEVLYSGNYVSGVKVHEFEGNFADYCNVKYGIAVNSGTAALHVALSSFGIGPGDEVIVPAMTFFSTATAVLHQNAIPIFADINKKSYNIDPVDINERITDKTKAIIPVHFFGNPCEMTAINEIADDNGLLVIEDCAQAHGAEYHGEKVGGIGDAGCFSFFATKNMTTGEGGIIVTNDQQIAEKARMIRSHGMSDRNSHSLLGYNYRMNEFAAALGIVQLKKLDYFNNIRIENSRYLYEGLSDLNWLIIPKIESYVKHVFFWCPIQIDEEVLGMSTLDLRRKLLKKGIETRFRYESPLNMQEMLLQKNAYPLGCPFSCPFYGETIDYASFKYPNAENIMGKMLGLPNHLKLKKQDLDVIISCLQEV